MKKLFTPNFISGNRKISPHQVIIFKKIIFTLLLFASLLCIPLTSLMAQPTIEWENTIQATEQEEFAVAKPTADGGYILGGTSFSNAALDKSENPVGGMGLIDYWVVKLNAAGTIAWEQTLGGNGSDHLISISQTADDGYIVAGWSDSNASGDKSENNVGTIRNIWIIKLDAAGNKQWDKTLETGGSLIEQTPDGGYILSGNGTVLKLDASRNVLWQKSIGGSLQQTADQGFILVGSTLAVKLNASGTIEWEQPLAAGTGNLYYSQQTADGGYIMGGNSGDDYYVLKLDAAGNKEWDKIIGGLSLDWLRAIRQTADGGYILGGDSHSGAGGDKTEVNRGPLHSGNNYYYTDYWVVKLDAAGNREWDKTLGGIFHEQLRSLEQTADGDILIGGLSESYGKDMSSSFSGISDKTENSNNFDYWIVKLNGTLTTPPAGLCKMALTSKVTQAEPWYGIYPGGEGSIDITVTGGTAPYTYRWNTWNPSPVQDYLYANPGVHAVIVTDAQGCTLRATIEVGKKNDPLRLQATHTNVTTDGAPVGSIDLTVVGGVVPATYKWSNGATTEDLTGLAEGVYTVVVTDAFGRQATTSVTISNPRTPTVICDLALTTKNTQGEPWYGMWGPTNGAGSIDLIVAGGAAPYTYKWNTGASTEDIPVAAPGMYSVTVSDARGCTAQTSVSVGRKNDPLTLYAATINVSAAGRAEGSINLSVVGGVVPATYKWSNGATTEDLTGLAAGSYTVVVTDAFGRKATITVQVLAPGTTTMASAKKPGIEEDLFVKQSALTVYPNPATNRVKVSFNPQDSGKFILDLYDIRGAKVKTIASGQGPGNKAMEVDLVEFAEGVYLLKLITDEGVSSQRLLIQK